MLNIALQMWVKDLHVFGFLNYHHFFEKFKSLDWTLCKFKGVILFVWRSPLSADETIVRSRTAVIAWNNRCVILSMTQRNAKRDTANTIKLPHSRAGRHTEAGLCCFYCYVLQSTHFHLSAIWSTPVDTLNTVMAWFDVLNLHLFCWPA